MKRQPGGMVAFVAIALVSLGTSWVQADHPPIMRILARPLTPQEISDYGMTNTTQIASGNHVVGIGQPVYLEFLVQNGAGGRHPVDYVTVTNLTWSLGGVVNAYGQTVPSSAELTDSLLPTNMPTFDGGHDQQFSIVDRAMIVPDTWGTYPITLDVEFYNETEATNGTAQITYDVVGSSFIGKDSASCSLCHASKMDDFNMTHHASAFKEQINGEGSSHFNPNCISCHVLGYDTAPLADNGGFDDVAADLGWTFPTELSTNNWDDMPVALQMRSNIQCENCHGPAQEHWLTANPEKIAVNLSAGNCSQCHDKMSHHIKTTEWKQSPHAIGYVFRDGSCGACHSTVGFINTNDPGMNELAQEVEVTGTYMEGITCAACHDPHAATENFHHQTRGIDSVMLANGTEITTGGTGRLCMACHHDRYEANDRASQGRTPHHGTQTDLLFGENAIEYGRDMPSSKHGTVVADTCVQCHMQERPAELKGTEAEYLVGEHSFMLSYNDGTNAPIHLTETCASCHGDIEDFDFGGEDYDLDGVVEGVQSEITDMMDELALLVAAAPSGDSKNKANYNLVMVEDDGSKGVHNPKYIAAILRSSIDDLKGGIDIDKDGLVDEWEIANFGDLTSQSGTDDYDGDGLNNAQEQNLGTDPMLTDTDGDGISDLVEVQAGSDPLDINSVPTSDMLIMNAIEVGYLPQATGTVVQIQKIDSLTGGVWQSVGPAQTNTGSWVFQLDSTRGNTNVFYRAIEQ